MPRNPTSKHRPPPTIGDPEYDMERSRAMNRAAPEGLVTLVCTTLVLVQILPEACPISVRVIDQAAN